MKYPTIHRRLVNVENLRFAKHIKTCGGDNVQSEYITIILISQL